MNPWANIQNSDDPQSQAQAEALKVLLSDRPGENGSVQPTVSPLDFPELVGAGAEGVATLGKSLVDSYPTLLANEAGEIRGPWSRLERVTAGQNPLELSKKDWGQWISKLGPSVRDKNSEIIGAQLADEFGHLDPQKLIGDRFSKEGFGREDAPSLHILGLDDGLAGLYNPDSNKILVNAAEEERATQHPTFNLLGTVGHETQHALDYIGQDYLGSPEMIVGRPFTNNRLAEAGIMDPSRVETVLRAAKEDPSVMGQIPYYLQDALSRGASPKQIAEWFQYSNKMKSSMGDIFRTSVGNGGFRGDNQYLADQIMSKGHFASPIGGEMDLAPHYLAKQEASLGNGDIHPDWISSDVKKALDSYESPAVSVPAQIEAQRAAWNPWLIGGGLGAGAAITKQLHDYHDGGIGSVESGQGAHDIIQPSPRPENFEDGDAEIQKLLNWLHQQGYSRN